MGLQKAKLPTALAISFLLNPFFDQKPKVIGSGLMTAYQYMKAVSENLAKMQDTLDSKSTHPYHPSDSTEQNSNKQDLPPCENAN
jgi:flagellar basal body rod protein FlgC